MAEQENTQKGDSSKKQNKRIFPIILGIVVLIGGSYGTYKLIRSFSHEETEDAQVESDINKVMPRVPGYIEDLRVEDNDQVQRGDTLLTLDDEQLKIKVKQAQAALQNARAQLKVARANVTTAQAGLVTARANYGSAGSKIDAARVAQRKANKEYERFKKLHETESVTQQQFDNVEAAKEAADKHIEVLENSRSTAVSKIKSAKTQVAVSKEKIEVSKSVVEMRQSDLENARLNLSYATITAPASGVISKNNIEEGQLVQAGTSLFAIVQSDDKWVVANFKETQLDKIRVDQKVDIKVDAYPNRTFRARVQSISPATGARFSLLPPENATGNFVKVVQRVPVKIVFNDSINKLKRLRAGMNVLVDIHVD